MRPRIVRAYDPEIVMTAYDRSSIFKSAWQIAREAAASTGEAVRLFIGNALRRAWSLARADRAAAALTQPTPVQQQQAQAGVPEPVEPAPAPEPAKAPITEWTGTMIAVENDYSSRMRGGTYYLIVYLPDGNGGYLPGERADKIEGAVILSRAAYIGRDSGYARADDRKSETKVRLTVPVGTITKSTRGWADMLAPTGKWVDIDIIGNVRRGTGWATKVKVDGKEIELA